VPPRWRARLVRLLLAVAGVLIVSNLAFAPTASAHAGLVRTDPSEGTVLDQGPGQVRLVFNEPVGPVTSSFALYDSKGRHTTGGEPTAVDVNSLDAVVTAKLPTELARGSYVLSWRVVSADAHPISGALPFAVGQASAAPPPVPDADPESLRNPVNTTYLALQILGYLGLLAAVGLRVFDSFVRVGPDPGGRQRLLAIGVGLSVVAYGVLVPLAQLRERGASLSSMLTTSAWSEGLSSASAATFALAAVGGLLLLIAGQLPRPAARLVGLVGALVAISSVLPTGHTRTYGPQWLMFGLDLVHTAAAAVWFGGLIGLGLHLIRSRRRGRSALPVATTVARFSGLAGVLVGLLGLSGFVMAWQIVGTVGAVFTSDYGRALLVKLALVAVVGLLAIWNRFALVKSVQRRGAAESKWRRLNGALVDEAAVVVIALAVTGLLTMQSPTRSGDGTDQTTVSATAPTGSVTRAPLGSGTVEARLMQTSDGGNAVELILRDSTGAPLQNEAVPKVVASLPAASLGPLPTRLSKLEGPGHYQADMPVPVGGDWRFVVSVQLSDFDSPTATLLLSVPS
jgi:copper transport protein